MAGPGTVRQPGRPWSVSLDGGPDRPPSPEDSKRARQCLHWVMSHRLHLVTDLLSAARVDRIRIEFSTAGLDRVPSQSLLCLFE